MNVVPNLKFVALPVPVGSIATLSGRVSGQFFWPGSSSDFRSRLTLWLLVERCGRWLLLLLLLLWSASQRHETLVVSSQKSQSRKMKLSGWGIDATAHRHTHRQTDRQTNRDIDWKQTASSFLHRQNHHLHTHTQTTLLIHITWPVTSSIFNHSQCRRIRISRFFHISITGA